MEKHSIDRLFEEKLKDFADIPTSNLWERIEKQIPHQKEQEKGFLRRFWWILLLLLPVGGSIWYLQYTTNDTHVQKMEKNTAQMPQTAHISENKENSESKSEKIVTQNGLIEKKQEENASKQPVNKEIEKTEKNIKTDATPKEQNASTIQQAANEKETLNQEPAKQTETNTEKKTDNAEHAKETTKKTDTIKNLQPKKGVKVIIKLSEPEEPKEGKARDFASTKAGKFLKKAKKIKEGEAKIPPLTITLNH